MDNKLTLTQVIQEIRKITKNVKLELWSDNNVNFCVYESEIVIELDKNGKTLIDVEYMHSSKISSELINDLFKIMKLIEDNSEVILRCVKDLLENDEFCPDCGTSNNTLGDGSYKCKYCDCIYYD